METTTTENGATNTKSGISYVKADKPITAKEGKVSLDNVEVKQYGSIDAATQDAGSADELLAYLNRCADRDAKGVGRVSLSQLSDEEVAGFAANTELQDKIRAAIRNWTPSGGRGEGVKARAEKFDKVEDFLKQAPADKTFTREELLAIVMGQVK